jgi:hypothetical protein
MVSAIRINSGFAVRRTGDWRSHDSYAVKILARQCRQWPMLLIRRDSRRNAISAKPGTASIVTVWDDADPVRI